MAKLIKLLKSFLLLSLIFLPLGEILRINITSDIVIRPLDVSICLTAIALIFFCIKDKKFPKAYLFKPIIIFAAIGVVSLLVNAAYYNQNQFLASLLYLIRWLSYSMIYVAITKTDKKFRNIIIWFMVIGGIFVLLTGYAQFFLYPNLRNLYYLGWDEHNYRMFSVFLDPNFAGVFFVLFFLFVGGLLHNHLLIRYSGERRGSKISKHNNQSDSGQARMTIISLLVLLLIAIVIAVFLTYSRSAILMLVAGITAYLGLTGKKKFIFALIGLIAVFVLTLSPTFNKENTNLFRTTSSFARLETYSNSIKIFMDHPIFGVGFNAYRYAQQSYGFRNVKTKFPNHADAGADNSFLFVLATTGVVGLSAYLFIWYSVLKRALYIYHKNSNMLALVVVCSSIGLFVNSFFINSLFFPNLMFWMWVTIGLAESH